MFGCVELLGSGRKQNSVMLSRDPCLCLRFKFVEIRVPPHLICNFLIFMNCIIVSYYVNEVSSTY